MIKPRISPECRSRQHESCEMYWDMPNNPDDLGQGFTKYLCDCDGGGCHQNQDLILAAQESDDAL